MLHVNCISIQLENIHWEVQLMSPPHLPSPRFNNQINRNWIPPWDLSWIHSQYNTTEGGPAASPMCYSHTWLGNPKAPGTRFPWLRMRTWRSICPLSQEHPVGCWMVAMSAPGPRAEYPFYWLCGQRDTGENVGNNYHASRTRCLAGQTLALRTLTAGQSRILYLCSRYLQQNPIMSTPCSGSALVPSTIHHNLWLWALPTPPADNLASALTSHVLWI